MSGQPYRYASDVEKYRTEYMNNLNERSLLDDKVLQAVKTYVSNGTLPAISQIPDTRTTSEKLLDIQSLKTKIIKDLSSIMDASIASTLIQGLVQSPLNIDNKLIIFMAQRTPEIVKQLEKSYQYGIKGDSNDIYTFVEFVNRMYSDKNNTTASVKSLMDSGYSSNKGMVSGRDLDLFWSDLDKIFQSSTIANNYTTRPILDDTRQKIINLRNWLPNDKDLSDMLNEISSGVIGLQSEEAKGIIDLTMWMTSRLPNKETLKSLANSLKTYILDNNRNGRKSESKVILQYLNKINELIPEVPNIRKAGDVIIPNNPSDGTFIDGLVSLTDDIDRFRKSIKSKSVEMIHDELSSVFEKLDNIRSQNAEMLAVKESKSLALEELMNKIESSKNKKQLDNFTLELQQILDTMIEEVSEMAKLPEISQGSEMIGEPEPRISKSNISPIISQDSGDILPELERQEDILKQGYQQTIDYIQDTNETINTMNDKLDKHEQAVNTKNPKLVGFILDEDTYNATLQQVSDNTELLNNLMERKDKFITEIDNKMKDIDAYKKGIGGNGFKKRRGRPKGCGIKIPVQNNIDYTRGIEQSLKFSPFGKYIIHNGKLRDNVISLKNIKGGNVIGLPSNKVSSNFGKVMKTIIGGGLPSFNDMNGLSEEEKKYLYLISSKANIVDKLNIPTPSKDQEEKDLHLFEVYKGEIMAGNDSKELIQKFKVLLLKLSRTGILPKQQVNEILNEILQLGY